MQSAVKIAVTLPAELHKAVEAARQIRPDLVVLPFIGDAEWVLHRMDAAGISSA